MAESEGAYVIDSEGNRYIDGIGGLWCVNIGYANERNGTSHRRTGAKDNLLLNLRASDDAARCRTRSKTRRAHARQAQPCVLRNRWLDV